MVEFGVVVSFTADKTKQGGQSGLIRPFAGDKQSVKFYTNQARRPEADLRENEVEFNGRIPTPAWHRPKPGDQVAFERNQKGNRTRVWTYRFLWDSEVAKLSDERELDWRIVLKGYETTGITHFAGTVDETGREDTLDVVLNGTRQGSLKNARRWTAIELGFYHGSFDDYKAQGYGSYSYYLQVKLPNGKWQKIKSIDPLPEPDEPSDWFPDDDNEIDADSLAEIQHGRAHEMYNS